MIFKSFLNDKILNNLNIISTLSGFSFWLYLVIFLNKINCYYCIKFLYVYYIYTIIIYKYVQSFYLSIIFFKTSQNL